MVFDAKFNKIIVGDENANVKLAVSKWLEDDLKYLASNIDTEFAFYLKEYEKREYRGVTYFVVPHQEIIIPKQKATTAEVEITENLPYPINGHKHPDGVTTFSSVDLEYITNNANISLLITRNGIVEATIRVVQRLDLLGDTMILIRTKDIVRVLDEPKEFDLDAKIKEIKEKLEVPKPTVQYSYPYYYHDDHLGLLTDEEKEILSSSKKKKKKKTDDDIDIY